MNSRTVKAVGFAAALAASLLMGPAVADNGGSSQGYTSVVDEENLDGTPTVAVLPLQVSSRRPVQDSGTVTDTENLEGYPTGAVFLTLSGTGGTPPATSVSDQENLEGTPTDAAAIQLYVRRAAVDQQGPNSSPVTAAATAGTR